MDEVQRIIMEVVNRDKLEQLNEALRKEQQFLKGAVDALKDHMITQTQFDAAAAKSAGQVLALQGQMKQLAGSPGIGGNGILQASWAVQDFTSVLAGGQGLGRAIASVQNNIPGLLMSLGMSGGIAGAVSLVSVGIGALIPLIEKMWGSFDDKEALEGAKQRLQEFKSQLDATRKEFEKLTNAPTDPEKLSAEGIGMFLRQRPNAEKTRAAVAAGVSEEEARGALSEKEQKLYWQTKDAAGQSDEALRTKAAQQAARDYATSGGEGATPQHMIDAHFEAMAGTREAMKQERDRLMHEGRSRRAQSVITGAMTAGPAGAASREELLRKTLGVPGLEELQGYDPDRLARSEREAEEQDEKDKAEDEAVRKYRAARAKAIERRKFRAHLNSGKTDAILQGHTQKITEQRQAANEEVHQAERDFAGTGAEFQQADQERKQQRFGQARQLGRQAAAQFGFQGPTAPTKDEADDIARDILQNMQNGLNASEAANQAILDKMRSIQAAQARFSQSMQARAQQFQGMNMGADQGQFSTFPPTGW